MTAAAKMPSSLKFGRYGKIAVVETDGINMPKQINPRHKSVKRVVEVWDRLNIGITDRCAFKVALREATAMADRMNGGDVC
jgi:hypothetical protein